MKFKSEILNELNKRGFINQCSDIEGLDNLFTSENVVMYLGSDPTADSLHVGHLVPVMMMRWAQKYGHTPILLIGGATAHIGDPDKDTERPILMYDVIVKNSEGLKKSYSKFLQFEDKNKINPAIMVDNYDWFKDINYLNFLRNIGMVVSVNKLITLDRIKKRLDKDLHLSFLELNYPLFQSFDFLHLHKKYNCKVQLCGADQWGNAIGGVDLIKRKTNHDSYVLTAPLLTTSDGKKMGKSEGNAVWINEDKASNWDYYQFFRNVPDDLVIKMLYTYTELDTNEINKLSKLGGSELNEAKKILAFEATKICRGIDAANLTQKTAIDTFENKKIGEDLPVFIVNNGQNIVDILITCNAVKSKSEARRLIDQGGIKINDYKINTSDYKLNIDNNCIMSIGKKNKLVLKKS